MKPTNHGMMDASFEALMQHSTPEPLVKHQHIELLLHCMGFQNQTRVGDSQYRMDYGFDIMGRSLSVIFPNSLKHDDEAGLKNEFAIVYDGAWKYIRQPKEVYDHVYKLIIMHKPFLELPSIGAVIDEEGNFYSAEEGGQPDLESLLRPDDIDPYEWAETKHAMSDDDKRAAEDFSFTLIGKL